MDGNGQWHNAHGKFEHPRIIKYFNASIKKDKNGYFVHQVSDLFEEKVYFKYEDTAVFVTGVKENPGIVLYLNTGQTCSFEPEHLFVKKDRLYMKTREHLIQFTSKAMISLSKYLKEEGGGLFFSYQGKSWPLDESP